LSERVVMDSKPAEFTYWDNSEGSVGREQEINDNQIIILLYIK